MKNSPRMGALTAVLLTAIATTSAPAHDFVWPVSGRVTATWYYPGGGFHGAVDIAVPYWTSVRAARGGRTVASVWNRWYGYYVRLAHGAGYTTDYHHLVRRGIAYGSSVARLQHIGYSGSTGNSTGPHVHFDVRRYGVKQYLPAYRGRYVTRGIGIPKDFPGIY